MSWLSCFSNSNTNSLRNSNRNEDSNSSRFRNTDGSLMKYQKYSSWLSWYRGVSYSSGAIMSVLIIETRYRMTSGYCSLMKNRLILPSLWLRNTEKSHSDKIKMENYSHLALSLLFRKLPWLVIIGCKNESPCTICFYFFNKCKSE